MEKGICVIYIIKQQQMNYKKRKKTNFIRCFVLSIIGIVNLK